MQPSKKCRLYCREGCCNGVAAPGNHLVYWRCNKGCNLHNFTHSSLLATSLPRIYSNSLVGKFGKNLSYLPTIGGWSSLYISGYCRMGLNSGKALGKILTNKSVIRSAADNSCRTTGASPSSQLTQKISETNCTLLRMSSDKIII